MINKVEKEKFKDWLVGQGYTPNTSNSYASSINKISRHLSKKKSKLIDVFEIDDLSALKELVEQYGLTGKHSSFGYEGNGSVRNAIKAYYKYRLYYNRTSSPAKKINTLQQRKRRFSEQQTASESKGAIFVGSKKEFKRYIGPLLRNLVQQMTRKHKRQIGKCQDCESTDNLEAAHINGRDRNAIIDSILSTYSRKDQFHVPLVEFEQKFRQEHNVIEETVQVLCKDCHTQYDSNTNPTVPVRLESSETKKEKVPTEGRIYSNSEIQWRLSRVLKKMTEEELESYCDKNYSKKTFNLDTPLLIKAKKDTSQREKRTAVLDKNIPRWTWKYEIEKKSFIYALSTQWYSRNDIYVENWLRKYSNSKVTRRASTGAKFFNRFYTTIRKGLSL